MARPNQKGLIYFSLDTKLDEKFDLIESKLGIAGFGVVIKLLQKIYSEGYFIEWNERELLKFKVRVNVEVNFINEVVQEALKWELFDNKLYETYGILTSHGIQMRYIEGTQRRKEIEFIKEYLLVSQSNLKYPSGVKVNINSINVDNNPKKEEINSQSKVKYSKENESKDLDAAVSLEGDHRKNDLKPEPKNPASPVVELIVRTWEKNFGFTIPGDSSDKLLAWNEQDRMEAEVICEAIRIAAGEGKRSLKYVEGILDKWRIAGVKDLNGVKNYQAEWKANKPQGKPQNKDQPVITKPPLTPQVVNDFWDKIQQAEEMNGRPNTS